MALRALAHFFNRREAPAIVQPKTSAGWHRTVFQAFWQWSRGNLAAYPCQEAQGQSIREMAAADPTWGEERIVDQLWQDQDIHASPRTAGKRWDSLPPARSGTTSRLGAASPPRESAAGYLTNAGGEAGLAESCWTPDGILAEPNRHKRARLARGRDRGLADHVRRNWDARAGQNSTGAQNQLLPRPGTQLISDAKRPEKRCGGSGGTLSHSTP